MHDHGSWGVVGVVEGVLEERSYVRLSPDRGADEGIDLVRGGMILLRHGAVTSFVPNPDHIHVTGVPAERPRAVSLHLYGRMMSDFNIYDVDGRTRRRIEVAHRTRARSAPVETAGGWLAQPATMRRCIAILTFEGFNELDSLIALGVLNRIRKPAGA